MTERVVHVAVDAHNLSRDNRGIGRYARAVLSRALNRKNVRFTLVVRGLLPRAAALSRALGGAAVTVARRIPRDADVVWFPWNGTFLETNLPSVATIHDAAPFAFPASDPRRRRVEQIPFLKTAATAAKILVQSAFTASEVERRLEVARERIVVTPLAADPVFSVGPVGKLPAAVAARPYILHVGAHDERKNTTTLRDAYARAFPGGEIALAFTHRPPWPLPAGAVVAGAPDDVTLAALYRGATLVAMPSTYEGFGFPLIEAMACGTPVLAANAGSLPAIGGDAAAYVDEALDAVAWSAALHRLINDEKERARRGALGPGQAATFSWERCTDQTLSVLRDAASH
ncbi:MAG: glycosyltransferase family 4 protein [Candidatus Eremiobacteraeota bacterium]|nr:glycosyltransferase family 4 protein [Candidatus Eremiobacteraeota bacterium]